MYYGNYFRSNCTSQLTQSIQSCPYLMLQIYSKSIRQTSYTVFPHSMCSVRDGVSQGVHLGFRCRIQMVQKQKSLLQYISLNFIEFQQACLELNICLSKSFQLILQKILRPSIHMGRGNCMFQGKWFVILKKLESTAFIQQLNI